MKHTSNGGDKLEELFQNASAQYEVQPDPAGWERLHSQLRARQAPARRLFLLRSAFMILGFMLARYGLLNLHTDRKSVV